jgi:hypothetical protein
MTYRKGNIYKIICKLDNNICYIGSTLNEVRHRWQGHKGKYKLYLEDEKSCIAVYPYFTKYGIENFKAIPIKSYLVYAENKKDHRHLSVYEQLWINKTKNCVNTSNPFGIKRYQKSNWYKNNREKTKQRSRERYNEDTEKILEKQKEYYDKNKETILEQQKEYALKNKDKIKVYKAKYRADNREELIKVYSEYYYNNRDKLLKQKKEKIVCDCGFQTSKNNKARHLKSKKHLNWVKSQED